MPLWLAVPVWVLDLSVTDGGLVSAGDTAQWEWGVPTVGPVGDTSWGTRLDGPYLHDTVDTLEARLPDLSTVAEPSLVLHHWYAIRPGDGGLLEIDDGAGFVPLAAAYGYPDPDGFVGQSGGWVDHVFPLDGHGPTPRVRLVFTADANLTDAGWYVQTMSVWDGDILRPQITVVAAPTDTQDLVGPYVVSVDVADDRGAVSTTLWVSIDGGDPVATAMTPTTGIGWSAEIAAQPPGTTVAWWVDTTDGENVGRWPAAGEETFRVYLAAPTNLVAPDDDGRLVATEVKLAWDPPVSPNEVLGYEVRREGVIGPVAEVAVPEATVPLGTGPQQFRVTAVYEAGLGDPSEVLELAVEVPVLALEPAVVYQGEDLHLRVEGMSLYLLQDQVSLDLGPGVEVTGIDVRDAHALVAHLTVAPEADVGLSDVTLGSTAGTFVFGDRFEIRDGADAPRIRRIAPASMVQGDEVEIALDATVPFAAVPVIGTDEDLLVTSAATVDGTTARFSLAVSGRARIGLHSLSVDDGERLYTIDLQVEEYVARVEPGCGGCATGPDGGAAGFGGLLLALGRRRRRTARSFVAPVP